MAGMATGPTISPVLLPLTYQSLGPQNFSISRTRQLLCSVNKVLGWDPLELQEALKALLHPPAVVADPELPQSLCILVTSAITV